MSWGTRAPIQPYYSGVFKNKCSGSFLGRCNRQPWAELCWCGPRCGLWLWPSISSDEAGGQLLGTSGPQSPPTACAAPAPFPTRGNAGAGRRNRSGRLAAQGGPADLMQRQGTKAFSFPAASNPTPHRTTPWAPQPQAQPPPAASGLGLLPDKAGFRPGRAVGRQARGFRHGDEL